MASKKSRNLKSHDEIMCNDMCLHYENAPTTEQVISTVTDVVRGVSVKSSEVKTVNLSDRYKGLTAYDFSIDSLAASGMLNQMSFSTLSDSNSFGVVDRLDVISQQVGESMNNNNNNIE